MGRVPLYGVPAVPALAALAHLQVNGNKAALHIGTIKASPIKAGRCYIEFDIGLGAGSRRSIGVVA